MRPASSRRSTRRTALASDSVLAAAYVPAIGAVQRWFVRQRGFASGLAVSGIGVGTLVMPPVASFLIELWAGGTHTSFGVAAAVVGGLALLIENDPRDRGLAGRHAQPGSDAARPAGPPCGMRSRRAASPLCTPHA